MRVLMMTPGLSRIGGVELHVSGVRKELLKKGINVDVLSSENLPIIPVQGLKNASLSLSASLKRLISSEKYDIVHAHNMPMAFPALVRNGARRILTLHGVYAEQVSLLHGSTIGGIIKPIEKIVMEKMDIITAISKEVVRHYYGKGFKVEYVPNGIDKESLNVLPIRLSKFQIAYAGRLSKEKGVDLLIEAVKNIPKEMHLIIIGGGPEETALRRIAQGDNRISFMGPKDHNTTLQMIRGSDILVLPRPCLPRGSC